MEGDQMQDQSQSKHHLQQRHQRIEMKKTLGIPFPMAWQDKISQPMTITLCQSPPSPAQAWFQGASMLTRLPSAKCTTCALIRGATWNSSLFSVLMEPCSVRQVALVKHTSDICKTPELDSSSSINLSFNYFWIY